MDNFFKHSVKYTMYTEEEVGFILKHTCCSSLQELRSLKNNSKSIQKYFVPVESEFKN